MVYWVLGIVAWTVFGRGSLRLFHFGFHLTAGMLATAGPFRPHTAVSVISRLLGGTGWSAVSHTGRCNRPWQFRGPED